MSTKKAKSMLCDIHVPQTQKVLFNQKCVSDIKKFIKDNLSSTTKDYKKILFLNGPSGCGKTATVNVLFKNYNIINLDSDNIRVIDNIADIVSGIPAFNSQNLLFLEKKPSKSHLGNLLLIKNAQHCEKSLCTFIEQLYVKCKRNIPIIISNDKQSFRQKFKQEFPITFIDFQQPTVTELTQLINTINTDYKFGLSDTEISKIIETSIHDIHQIFHILEYIKINKHIDINCIDNLKKDHDIDLSEKLQYLFDFDQKYDFQKLDDITNADSYVISNSIFQNYPNLFIQQAHEKRLDDIALIEQLNVMSNIADTFCIESDDCFDLNNIESLNYNSYNVTNCIYPLYKIHHYKETNDTKINKLDPNNIDYFKNFSYNYLNSFEELKSLTLVSNNNLYGVNEHENRKMIHNNKTELWIIIQAIIDYISNINKILDIKKRNVQAEEYLKIIKKDETITKQLQFIIHTIWSYSLFETNDNINKIKYKQDEITIDIRIFKRFINIFSLSNTSKLIKMQTENVIKYELTQKIVSMQNEKIITNKSHIENLTYDLCDIWSCMKIKN